MTKKSNKQFLKIGKKSYSHQITTEECFMLQEMLKEKLDKLKCKHVTR